MKIRWRGPNGTCPSAPSMCLRPSGADDPDSCKKQDQTNKDGRPIWPTTLQSASGRGNPWRWKLRMLLFLPTFRLLRLAGLTRDPRRGRSLGRLARGGGSRAGARGRRDRWIRRRLGRRRRGRGCACRRRRLRRFRSRPRERSVRRRLRCRRARAGTGRLGWPPRRGARRRRRGRPSGRHFRRRNGLRPRGGRGGRPSGGLGWCRRSRHRPRPRRRGRTRRRSRQRTRGGGGGRLSRRHRRR